MTKQSMQPSLICSHQQRAYLNVHEPASNKKGQLEALHCSHQKKKKRDQGPLSSHLRKQSGHHPHRITGFCSADVTHSGLESQAFNERRTGGSAGVMTSCWCPFWKLVVSRKVLWTQPFPVLTPACPCVFGVTTLAGPRWPHPALLLPVLTEQQIKPKLQTHVHILIA